jgi:hypothetical protein
MKKICVLIMYITGCGSVLFAQAEAGFDTEAAGDGVVITGYRGEGGHKAYNGLPMTEWSVKLIYVTSGTRKGEKHGRRENNEERGF